MSVKMKKSQIARLNEVAPKSFVDFISPMISERTDYDRAEPCRWYFKNAPTTVFLENPKDFLATIDYLTTHAEELKYIGIYGYQYCIMKYNDSSSCFLTKKDEGYKDKTTQAIWFEVKLDGKVFKIALAVCLWHMNYPHYIDGRDWWFNDFPDYINDLFDVNQPVNMSLINKFIEKCRGNREIRTN